jgi:hypothetical protein
MARRKRTLAVAAKSRSANPDAVCPATREEMLPVGLAAVVAGSIALAVSALHGTMLLYGDAVAHLGIARGILDTRHPGLANLGGVWLPLPHLLMLPFVGRLDWWQNGMAGAWPSLICYVLSVMGFFCLARRVLAPRWALVATAFFGLNANLLYLSTTAMTEPLFLALLVWMLVVLVEVREAIFTEQLRTVTGRLLVLGLLVFAATMTRYDGWVLGALIWCCVAYSLWKHPSIRRRVAVGFVVFTLLALAGPLLWFWYNHVFGHDWLDFMRGPYSPAAIDRKTSPPGSHKYWGWHNPAWSLMLYARTAQVDAAWWETGWLVAAAALWGGWKAWHCRLDRATLLLWFPLPFYVYAISYSSVPIFIPQLYPHSFYNSRYGMEMLPALALYGTYALAGLAARFGAGRELATRLIAPVAGLLCVVNLVLMLHATPLVLKEAMVNSRGRLALEEPIAKQLEGLPPGSMVLMDNSDHMGALQAAAFPLRQTIDPNDYYGWKHGLADPASTANYIFATVGSDLAKAAKDHPDGLTELSIVCTSGQPCLRIYQSNRYKQP